MPIVHIKYFMNNILFVKSLYWPVSMVLSCVLAHELVYVVSHLNVH